MLADARQGSAKFTPSRLSYQSTSVLAPSNAQGKTKVVQQQNKKPVVAAAVAAKPRRKPGKNARQEKSTREGGRKAGRQASKQVPAGQSLRTRHGPAGRESRVYASKRTD